MTCVNPRPSFNTKPYWAEILSNPIHGLEALESASSELANVVHNLRVKDMNVNIDEMIESLEVRLQRASAVIRRLSNGSRPINRLPAEILQHIFSLVPERLPCTEQDTRTHWSFGALSFTHLEMLTQVCKRWYELVAGAPTLWSTYRDTPRGLVKPPASFATSFPTAPIDIYSNGSFSKPMEMLVRNEGPRIRQIYFHRIPMARIADALLSTLAALDLGSLEHCSIELPPNMGQDLHAPLFTVATASRLRSLLVQSRSILPAQEFRSLTRLVLSSHHIPFDIDSQTGGWDVLALLKLLAGAPKLEVLHLCRVRTRGGTQSGLPRVVLGHLRYLSYDSPTMHAPSLTALLSNIHIPADCRVYIDHIPFSVTSSTDVSSLIQSLSGNVSRKQMTIHFQSGHRQEAKVELPTITSDRNGRDVCGGACVVFRKIERDVDRFWNFLSAPAFLENSEEVRINLDGGEEQSAQRTACILSSLVKVRRLALSFKWPWSHEFPPPFRAALAPLIPLDSSIELACPFLQDLDIYVDVADNELVGNVIAEMLAARAACNKPVRRFVLYATDLSALRLNLGEHVTGYASKKIPSVSTFWDEWPRVPDDPPTADPGGDGLRDGYEPVGREWTTW
ncbi:hypothetical protein C8Q80DRAFT_1136164 [Daedaleopsis nitida]|nr:hypothetical protein C8Q80DRAFT_1136164 [Daedaleopsis nitida]